MKTQITICVDADIKQKAMDIIQNKMGSSMSQEVNNLLKDIVTKERMQQEASNSI